MGAWMDGYIHGWMDHAYMDTWDGWMDWMGDGYMVTWLDG